MSRPLRREALLLCNTPFIAALSNWLAAARTAARASAGSPASSASRALRTAVRILDFRILFFKVLRSVERMRFFADFVFATSASLAQILLRGRILPEGRGFV